jgi:hypothetical protein
MQPQKCTIYDEGSNCLNDMEWRSLNLKIVEFLTNFSAVERNFSVQ